MSEVSRVLVSSKGRAFFIEPLGYNPAINLFRFLTPNMRTEDERPLRRRDVRLIERYFEDVQVYYYYLFALGAIPFRKTRLFRPMLRFLEGLDRAVFRLIPWSKWYAWQVLLILEGPLKRGRAKRLSADYSNRSNGSEPTRSSSGVSRL